MRLPCELFSSASDLTSLLFHAGNESVAVVEYAVYQKVPVQRAKPDPKASSIDNGSSLRLLVQKLARKN